MDNSNKQNLTPELKEIYDRVMNTAAKPVVPVPPTGSKAATSTIGATTPEAPKTPAAEKPLTATAATTPPVPINAPPTLPDVADQTATTQVGGDDAGSSGEFLSSVSPRPLQDIGVKSFSFSGKKVTATTADEINAKAADQTAGGGVPQAKKGISKPILIALMFVFIIVWAVFWAVFLGLIKLR